MSRARGIGLVLVVLGIGVACGGRSHDAGPSSSSGGHEPDAGAAPQAGATFHRAGFGGAFDMGGAIETAQAGSEVGGTSSVAGASPLGSAGAGFGPGGAAGDGGQAGATANIPGDINDDGCVDLADYAVLARCWNYQTSHCGMPKADIQQDGWVDYADYLIFIKHWYQGSTCRAWCQVSVEDQGAAGAAGASAAPIGDPDLTGDGCVNFDDLDRFAQSYGCGLDCAAPGADLVPDGCVDDQDKKVLIDSFDTQGPCVQRL